MKKHYSLLLSACLLLVVSGSAQTSIPCQPAATMVAVPNTYGCFSLSVINPSFSANAYSWSFDDGSIETGIALLHCFSPGTVTTTHSFTLANNICVMPSSQVFTLALTPATQCVKDPPCYQRAALSVTVCGGTLIPEDMYTFSFGDGTSHYMGNHQYAQCGNYIASVKNWFLGQQDTCYSYVAINIPCASVPTGLREQSQETSQLKLFPNPASEQVFLESGSLITVVSVHDLSGRELLRQEVNALDAKVSLNNLPAGAYLMRVHGETGMRNLFFVRE